MTQSSKSFFFMVTKVVLFSYILAVCVCVMEIGHGETARYFV